MTRCAHRPTAFSQVSTQRGITIKACFLLKQNFGYDDRVAPFLAASIQNESNGFVVRTKKVAPSRGVTTRYAPRDEMRDSENDSDMIMSVDDELHEARMEKFALEKALESASAQISHLTAELSLAKKEAAAAIAERDQALRRVVQVEEEEKMAEHDAKEALHREMEARAELEKMAEAMEVLRQELAHAKKRKSSLGKDLDQSSMGSMSEEEMSERVNQADAAVAKANLMAEEAQQRAFEIRAEAALLVETVEDRAVEAVQAAQAEVAKLKAELERRGG